MSDKSYAEKAEEAMFNGKAKLNPELIGSVHENKDAQIRDATESFLEAVKFYRLGNDCKI